MNCEPVNRNISDSEDSVSTSDSLRSLPRTPIDSTLSLIRYLLRINCTTKLERKEVQSEMSEETTLDIVYCLERELEMMMKCPVIIVFLSVGQHLP